jgi:Protein of unknown function (DUF3703)
VSYRVRIQASFDREMAAARGARIVSASEEFRRLERAHVLGQAATALHVTAHVAMLRWAVRQGDYRELLGQIVRVAGAITKTALGWIPSGNTGGANVSPFRSMPIADDLAADILRARAH